MRSLRPSARSRFRPRPRPKVQLTSCPVWRIIMRAMWHRIVLTGPDVATEERRLSGRLDDARLHVFDQATRQVSENWRTGKPARLYFEQVKAYRWVEREDVQALYFNGVALRL